MHRGTRRSPAGRRRGVTLALLGMLALGATFAVVPAASAQEEACVTTRSSWPYLSSCVVAHRAADGGVDYDGWVSVPDNVGGHVDVAIFDENFRRVDNIRHSIAIGQQRDEGIRGHSGKAGRYFALNACDSIQPPLCGSTQLSDIAG